MTTMNYKDRIDKAYKDNRPETEMSHEDFILCGTILNSKQPEMNVDITKLNKNSEIYIHFMDLIESFSAQVFLKRLESLTKLKISLGALIMLFLTIEGPGNAIMVLYYLYNKLKPNTLISMDVYCKEAFPWGMFSEEQFETIWAVQKKQKDDDVKHGIGAPDNLLDYLETWKKP